jgi:DNA-binding protein HU-beta
VNKAEFIDALVEHLGDRKTSLKALDAMLEEIQRAVSKGEKVSFAGFGVFEKRQRAARMARNPRTGEAVRVKKTVVPAFRPGQGFKELVTGEKKMPKKPGAKKSTGRKATAKKTAPAKKATTRKTAAKKTVRTASKSAASVTKRVGATKKSAAKKTAKKATRRRLSITVGRAVRPASSGSTYRAKRYYIHRDMKKGNGLM